MALVLHAAIEGEGEAGHLYSEIGPQVGCVDQSHFTALLRRHVSMTPKSTETPHGGRYGA
jgi:hypothetical protein